MKRRIWPWRRACQAGVIVLTIAFPVFARYGHYLTARQLGKVTEKWSGTLPGFLLSASDRVLRLGISDGEGGVASRRPRKAILQRTRDFNGSPWSATVWGISLTDLLAVAESASASRGLRWVLLTGAALPLLGTLLLGRVYCGWICPMGLLAPMARRLRDVLEFLEINPLSLGLDRRDKYYLLGAGLLYGAVFGLPLLHHIYPPAILGREAHSAVAAFFDSAEVGHYSLFALGLSSASLFLLTVLLLEVSLLPGFWCKALCPGGAVYSILGRYRLVRVRRKRSDCTDCALCDARCPMDLKPMTDRTGPECDNCGVCIDSCPTGALTYAFSATDAPIGAKSPKKKPRSVLQALVLISLSASPSAAHHIMGIPHYSYDENYPQAPVIKLIEKVGEWEVQLTGYPGRPTPGVRSEIHVYAVHTKSGEPYSDELTLEANRLSIFAGPMSIYGPQPGRRDDNIHKFFPTYPTQGDYMLILHIAEGGRKSTLRFGMTVGEPWSPWRSLGGIFAAFILFFIIVRAIRIKRARHMARPASV